MLTSLYAKLAAAGLILALLLGAYAFVHHQGAAAQQKADQKVIVAQGDALAAAEQSLNAANSALRAASAAAQANKASADAAKQRADDARKRADEAKRALDAANATWSAKLKAAQGTKGCETLKENLCAAVFPY